MFPYLSGAVVAILICKNQWQVTILIYWATRGDMILCLSTILKKPEFLYLFIKKIFCCRFEAHPYSVRSRGLPRRGNSVHILEIQLKSSSISISSVIHFKQNIMILCDIKISGKLNKPSENINLL